MNSRRSAVFDPSLEVFKVHFDNDPIVPGLLLVLNELQQRSAPTDASTRVERLLFKAFVRPGQTVTYVNEAAQTRIDNESGMCCSFASSIAGALDAPEYIGQPCLNPVHVSPTREPQYWFLPEQVNVNEDGSHASTCVDLAQVIAQHGYLAQIVDPALLVVSEALGNLALVLQQRHAAGTPASYVFARFDALEIALNRTTSAAPLHLHTRVRHFGSFLAWDACAWDAQGVRLVVHNAISVKRKTP